MDPYWFKRSTSFLGSLLCWSRCQHKEYPWFVLIVTSDHPHGAVIQCLSQRWLMFSHDSLTCLAWIRRFASQMRSFAYSPASFSMSLPTDSLNPDIDNGRLRIASLDIPFCHQNACFGGCQKHPKNTVFETPSRRVQNHPFGGQNPHIGAVPGI